MTRIARKSDGRRIFTAKFKREQIGRVLRGELSVGELSKKLGIARSLLHRWKRHTPQGSERADVVSGRASPAREMRVDQYIRQLQLLVGKQTVELELLRAELDELKRGRRSLGVS